MSFTTQDKEARKFETDPADSSKVVVKTKVENTSSDPIPVVISNADNAVDIQVEVGPAVTIDDSTPVDIAVTGTPNINVTNTPSVTVSGQVDLDDATPIRVDVTNTTVPTSATIQNSSLNTNATIQGTADVNVTNSSLTTTISGTPGVNVVNSALTTKDQLQYTSSDITALGASTDLKVWTSAYADGVLVKEFVDSYQNEFEQVSLYTHPSLGDSNKALKKITQYSTQNSQTVIESIDFKIVDWDKDASITGSVSISASNVNAADPNSTISMHTAVADLTIVDNTLGDVTISLSGADANLYHIHNTNTGAHGSSMTYNSSHSYQIHTAGTDFSGSSYSHSVTATVTGVEFGVTDSVTISLNGTYTVSTPASFSNLYYLEQSVNKSMQSRHSEISPRSDQKFALSFWMKSSQFTTNAPAGGQRVFGNPGWNGLVGYSSDGFQLRRKAYGTGFIQCFFSSGYNYLVANYAIPTPSDLNNEWVHVLINYNYDSSANSGLINRTIFTNACDVYFNGVASSKAADTGYSSTSHSTVDIDHGINQGYWATGSTINGFVESYDELAYWENTSLTTQEIGLVYNSGSQVIDLQNTTNLTAPTHYWRHEDSSNLTYDSVSQSNNGTITNATHTALTSSDAPYTPASAAYSNTKYITGAISSTSNKKGLYSKFEPTDNKGWFPTQDTQNNFWFEQHDSTISFWYKGATNQNYLTPWWQMYANSNSDRMGGMSIWVGNGSLFLLSTGHLNNSQDRSFSTWSLSNMTDWTNITVTIQQSSNAANAARISPKLYINGVSQGPGSTGGSTSTSITQTNIIAFGVGALAPNYVSNYNNWYVYGGSDTIHMDEISTWRKELSQQEIRELLNLNQADGSGTATWTDAQSHSAATGTSYLERYVRCGDLAGDGTVLKDAIDSNFELDGNGGSNFVSTH